MVLARTIKQIFAGFGVVCAGVIAFYMSYDNNRGSVNVTENIVINGLSVSTVNLQIGDIWEDETSPRCDVPIKNVASHTIEIEDFTVSCSCLKYEPRSLLLHPDEEASLHVELESNKRGLDFEQAKSSFAIEIKPRIKGSGVSREAWILNGTVKRRLTLNLSHLDYADSIAVGEKPPTRIVWAVAQLPVKDLEVKIEPPVCEVCVTRDPANSGRFRLAFTPKGRHEPGRLEARAHIVLMTDDGRKVHGAFLPLSGTIQAAVRIVPSCLFLQSTPVGQVAQASLTLRLPSAAAYTLDHWEADSFDTRIERTASSTETEMHFQITQKVARVGDGKTSIRCIMKQSDGAIVSYPVEIYFRGEEPQTAK